MVKFVDDSTTHENYIALRRQLGEQQNSDIHKGMWLNAVESSRRAHIERMLERMDDMQGNRDLSWENYVKLVPYGNRAFKTEQEWRDQPLFIKAAIIPRKLFSERMREKDVPESEITPW